MHVDERIVEPLVREGTELMPASWEKAIAAASGALKKAGPRAAALADGETTNEEAFLLQRLFREGLGSGHLASRPRGELPLDVARALASPALQATIPDLEYAHAVLLVDCDPIDEAPVLDLRIRKGVRRHHVQVGVLSARPTALDPSASVVVRTAPGAVDAALAALDRGEGELADWLRDAGEDIVIVYGERALSELGARALLNIAARLNLSRAGAGLIEVPSVPNARGIREAGFAPGHGPGFATLAERGRDAHDIAIGLASGELATVWLNYVDPIRYHPNRKLWEKALGTAQTVIAVDTVLTASAREHADVVFPGEAYPEKEGTVTNLDGRVQRLRPAIGRPKGRTGMPGSGVRPGWQVLNEVAPRLRPGPRCAQRRHGLGPAVRRGAVLRGPERSTRSAAAASAGRSSTRIGARRGSPRSSARGRPSPPPAPAGCGSARSAACGPTRPSTSRRCCSSCARSRSSSCRPPTPRGSGSARATASRWATTARASRAP